ncbi:MAG TPA: site-2 protease family protein [Burkholderiales bacterium]|nr:site-2 protease family protein [Burkholderiales bacterium]
MGIPIGLDYSWFLIFALLTWMLASSYYPAEFKHWAPPLYWIMGAVTAVMLFVSVLLHELGHSVVALRYRIPVRSITLFLFGGVAQIGEKPPSPKAEFLIAIAGPIVSLGLALLFTLLKPAFAAVEPLWGLATYLAYINFGLAVFNLIPGFPLDGGRVFRAAVWAVTKDLRRATLIAANGGRFFGFLFIFVGVWQMLSGNLGGGLWIAFIGWFLDNAATAQLQQVLVQGLLAGHTVRQAMSSRGVGVPAEMTLQELVDGHILGTGRRCFLVNSGEEPVGLITLHRVKEVPRTDWGQTTAAEAMLPLKKVKRIGPDAELWSTLELMDREGVNQLPVTTNSQVVGMLSREDVITFLRTLRELGT